MVLYWLRMKIGKNRKAEMYGVRAIAVAGSGILKAAKVSLENCL
jgi:hypothetical protein